MNETSVHVRRAIFYFSTPSTSCMPSLISIDFYSRSCLQYRTVTHVADSGTLCTLSSSGEAGPEGSPFGSHVDYVLDEQVCLKRWLTTTRGIAPLTVFHDANRTHNPLSYRLQIVCAQSTHAACPSSGAIMTPRFEGVMVGLYTMIPPQVCDHRYMIPGTIFMTDFLHTGNGWRGL